MFLLIFTLVLLILKIFCNYSEFVYFESETEGFCYTLNLDSNDT